MKERYRQLLEAMRQFLVDTAAEAGDDVQEMVKDFDAFVAKQDRSAPPAVPFAERIYKVRTKMQLTQQEMAEKLGVAFATINRWENGRGEPSKRIKDRVLGMELFGK